MFGRPGVGKSHVACAIGHPLVGAGISVLFVPTYQLVQQLLAARGEWDHIASALRIHDGNISHAARALRMHRQSLQRKFARGWLDRGWLDRGWLDRGWLDRGWFDRRARLIKPRASSDRA